MKNLHFKDFFWSSDLTCMGGYDAILQYLSDGRRICKEVEEFLKARASIEEKYAKDLLGLSKKVCGHNEMNTLKRSLDMFKLRKSVAAIFLFISCFLRELQFKSRFYPSETENVSLSHLQLAQSMREEAKKLEEFRERQKEARKKTEQQMDVLHKHKSSQFKKTVDSKRTYEQKCRDKEEAEQNLNRNTNSARLMEKLCTKAQQAKFNAEEAERLYRQNVTSLAKVRDEWMREHVNACEAVERISYLRNTVWTHLNQLSQECVSSDEMNEEVRKSLEQCDVQEDIAYFINLRQTGDKPPAPVVYENFYSGQKTPTVPPPRIPPHRRGPLPDPTVNTSGEAVYSTVQDAGYSVIQF
ncbi:proline-serine-threonine phosphatase-interacting protein 2 isoform 2-T2 [Aulostomus maculatus]